MAKFSLAIALLLSGGAASFTPSHHSLQIQKGCTNTHHSIANAFTSHAHHNRYYSTILKSSAAEEGDGGDDEGMLSNEIETTVGGNWMKRSDSIDFMPAEMTNNEAGSDDSVYMDVGINGETFGTGELSRRMHEAMMNVATRKFPNGNIPEELTSVYLLYSMDASAKEAVKVAMDSNGYALNLGNDEAMQDEGAWGQISEVVLIDPTTGQPTKGEDGSTSYNSFMEAIENGGWEPGESYSFVVREVPGRKKAMDLEALLKALDPDGSLWEEAKDKGILMPGEEDSTLNGLSQDCEQRVKTAPLEATDEVDVFRGGTNKGYNVISRSDLLKESRNSDGTENKASELCLPFILCPYWQLLEMNFSTLVMYTDYFLIKTLVFGWVYCSIATRHGCFSESWMFDCRLD